MCPCDGSGSREAAMAKSNRKHLHRGKGNATDIHLGEIWNSLKTTLWLIFKSILSLWQLNPLSVLRRRQRLLYHLDSQEGVNIAPRWTERVADLFISDRKRRHRLMAWIQAKLPLVHVEDFTTSWHDGIALCALLETLCPGACPRYDLLKPHHRVNNCRLGLRLAQKYLNLRKVSLRPEEMATADNDTEKKILTLLQLIKWKHDGSRASSSPLALPDLVKLRARSPSKCIARGTGLKAGIVGRRAKFNIFTEVGGLLDLHIDIRGPNNEVNSERIMSLFPGITSWKLDDGERRLGNVCVGEEDGKTKYIEDCLGNTFIRQRSTEDDAVTSVIPFDYQSVGEGRFLVTYIPRSAGLHTITIKSHGTHIEGSPFEVKISDWINSWSILPKPRVITFDMLPSIDESARERTGDDATPTSDNETSREVEDLNARNKKGSTKSRRHKLSQMSKQLTITRKRVLKRVITRTGEELLVQDLTPSPTLSRQSSADISDLSEDDQTYKRRTSPLTRSTEGEGGGFLKDPPRNSNGESGATLKEPVPPRARSPSPLSITIPPPKVVPPSPQRDEKRSEGWRVDPRARSPRNLGHSLDEESLPDSPFSPETPETSTSQDLPGPPRFPPSPRSSSWEGNESRDARAGHQLARSLAGDARSVTPRRLSCSTQSNSEGSSALPSVTSEDGHDDGASPEEAGPLLGGMLGFPRNQASPEGSGGSSSSPGVRGGHRLTQSLEEPPAPSRAASPHRKSGQLQHLAKRWKTMDTDTHSDSGHVTLEDPCFGNASEELRKMMEGPELAQTSARPMEPLNFSEEKEDILRIVIESCDSPARTITNVITEIPCARPRSPLPPSCEHDVISSDVSGSARTEQVPSGGLRVISASRCPSPLPCDDVSSSCCDVTDAQDALYRCQEPRPARVSYGVIWKNGHASDMDPHANNNNDSNNNNNNNNSNDGGDAQRAHRQHHKGVSEREGVQDSGVRGSYLFESICHRPRQGHSTSHHSVQIVVPKPKADKWTQVTAAEIKAETLWKRGNMQIRKRRKCVYAQPQDACAYRPMSPVPEMASPKSGAGGENFCATLVSPTMPSPQVPIAKSPSAVSGGVWTVADWLDKSVARGDSPEEEEGREGPQRQSTVDTQDSGILADDVHFFRRRGQRMIGGISPTQNFLSGHKRIHRRPYPWSIDLDPQLIYSSSSSQETEAGEYRLALDVIEAAVHDTVRRVLSGGSSSSESAAAGSLYPGEETSFSDSELNCSQSSTARRRKLLTRSRLLKRISSRGLETWHRALGEMNSSSSSSFSLSVHDPAFSLSRSCDDLPRMGSPLMSDIGSHAGSDNVFDLSRDPDGGMERVPVSWLRRVHPFSSTSTEESYQGFGINKARREELLGELEAFRNLDIPSGNQGEVKAGKNGVRVKPTLVMSPDSPRSLASFSEELNQFARPQTLSPLHLSPFRNSRRMTSRCPSDDRSSSCSGSDFAPFLDDTSKGSNSPLHSESEEAAHATSPVSPLVGRAQSYPQMSRGGGGDQREAGEVQREFGSDQRGVAANEAKLEPSKEKVTYRVDNCYAFGPGLFYGHVGIKNMFQVWAELPGNGCLTVGMYGPRAHCVKETSVTYTGDNLYEVTYDVTVPGFYVITVKWGDKNLPNSPYICKVTY